MDIEQSLSDILNREIAVELLADRHIKLSDKEMDELMVLAKGNPFDAAIIQELIVEAAAINNIRSQVDQDGYVPTRSLFPGI